MNERVLLDQEFDFFKNSPDRPSSLAGKKLGKLSKKKKTYGNFHMWVGWGGGGSAGGPFPYVFRIIV